MSFVYGTLITSLRLNQNLVKQSNFKPNCGSLPYVCACGGRKEKSPGRDSESRRAFFRFSILDPCHSAAMQICLSRAQSGAAVDSR